MVGPTCFLHLNETHDLERVGWNCADLPKLWLYNLHYFDDLNAEDSELRAEWHRDLAERWVRENPPGSGVGWEPYPTSLRIVNWVKWALSGNELTDLCRHSLAIQARWLARRLEWHLLGNHLLSNAKALFLAGLFFTGREADGWRRLGQKLLDHELDVQVLDDGGHCELSPTYHTLALQDVLDCIHAAEIYGVPVNERWRQQVRAMVDWLATMTRPDDRVPLFADSAYGAMPESASIRDYALRLGFDWPLVPRGLTDLDASGYFRYEAERYAFFGDAGPIGPDYLPAHGHADAFSFELVVDGTPLVVDTGTSTYDDNARRAHERSTRAHNTVELAGVSQSELWRAFRVGRRARITERHVRPGSITAVHDGYRAQGWQHERTFEFESPRIVLKDRLIGQGPAPAAVARLHLGPAVRPSLAGQTVSVGPARFEFSGGQPELATYSYAPDFNHLVPAACIEVPFATELTTRIVLA